MTHLTIISHFHTVTKLIFYGATRFYGQTTFLKNWILCLFILWVICWNRFQTGLSYLDFSTNCRRKTHRLRFFRTRKDIRVHLIQTFSLYVSRNWGQLRWRGLLRLSWLPPFWRWLLFPARRNFTRIISKNTSYGTSYFHLWIRDTNSQVLSCKSYLTSISYIFLCHPILSPFASLHCKYVAHLPISPLRFSAPWEQRLAFPHFISRI